MNKNMDRIDIMFKSGKRVTFRNLISVGYIADIDEFEIIHDGEQVDRFSNSDIDHYTIY